jgi:hypothetical protein
MFRRITNRIINNVEGVIVREATKALTPHIQEAAEGIIDAVTNSTPTIRSTGGGTSVYLTKVKQDFKDFHAEDADTDIQTFLLEFLQLKYEGKQDFEKAKVSEKVLINMGDVVNSKLTNIKINHMAVGDYQKSLYSATIKYRVSIPFR